MTKINLFALKTERTRKERYTGRCWDCGFHDGLVYLSDPPKKKCVLTKEYKYENDVCDCKELVDSWNADEWIERLFGDKMEEKCEFCESHYKGDTLYESADWDGGIGYDFIRDIKYCPLCGKELKDD